MKTRKLSFEDLKKNQLDRRQTINVLGGFIPESGEVPELPTPVITVLIGPTGGGDGSSAGAGTVNPKP